MSLMFCFLRLPSVGEAVEKNYLEGICVFPFVEQMVVIVGGSCCSRNQVI